MTELKHTDDPEQVIHLTDLPGRPGLVITNRNVQVYMRGRPALCHLMLTQSCQPLARAGLSDINDGRGLSPGPPDKSVD